MDPRLRGNDDVVVSLARVGAAAWFPHARE